MAARWRFDEDEQLRRLYGEGVAVVDIARRLGRSANAVDARRRAIGLTARWQPRRWSPRQDALLSASARVGVPARFMAERLGLPLESVRRRRRALAPMRPRGCPYNPAEDRALGDALASGHPLPELSRQLGRTEGALRTRARSLGLLRSARRRRWTRAEDELIREGYEQGLRCDAIAGDLLQGARTPAAVSARARKLGLASYARVWTAEDDSQLRQLCLAGVPLYAAANQLVRTPEALRRRARKLGLMTLPAEQGYASGRRWTSQEDAVLRDFPGLNPARLATILGRSDRAVRRRRAQLGMSNRSPHHLRPPSAGVPPGERRLIARELVSSDPRRLPALARRLGRSSLELRRLAADQAASGRGDSPARTPQGGPRPMLVSPPRG